MSADTAAAAAGPGGSAAALRLEVFTSPTRPIPATGGTFSPVTSTLISGDRDAVLVDAQFIAADVDALGDLVAASGRRLTTIFVTHAHLDHLFGLGRLLERFPGARAVATGPVAADAAATAGGQLKVARALFGDAVVEPTVLPEALASTTIDLEGHELRAIDVGQGDISPTAVLHVPALDAVIAGDVVYDGIHQMMGYSRPEDWPRWIESVDRIERLGPKRVVAGHRRPDARVDDVAAILDGTRAYVRDFAEAAASASTPAELVAAMTARHPDRGNATTLEFSAAAALAAREGGADAGGT